MRDRSPASLERLVAADHRDLHDVGRGPLDHHVDREPLALLAQLPASRPELRDLAAPAEQGRDVAVLGSLRDRLLDPPGHGREARQVALDELVGLLLRDVEPVGHPPCGQAVDDAVVDHLRLGPHPGIDLVRCDPEHPAGGRGVDILALAEDLLQRVLAGDVGQQPQLDLRVVRRDEQVARARRRSRRGSRARARSGSGCSGGSGCWMKAARWWRRSG